MADRTTPLSVNRELNIESQVHPLVLASRFVGKLQKGTATPSVKNVERWICQNSAPITVTNFLDGQEGQEIVLLGDGQTTVANNANIVTTTGGNLLLSANVVYEFIKMNGVWYRS